MGAAAEIFSSLQDFTFRTAKRKPGVVIILSILGSTLAFFVGPEGGWGDWWPIGLVASLLAAFLAFHDIRLELKAAKAPLTGSKILEVFKATDGLHAHNQSANFNLVELKKIEATTKVAAEHFLPHLEYENWLAVVEADKAKIRRYQTWLGGEESREKEIYWSALLAGERFLQDLYCSVTGQPLSR